MARKWWTLVTVLLGMLMLLMDLTIVNVALPDIATSLGASFSDLQWTIDAYALSLAALLLIAGSLGDLFGHRRVFAVGLVVFSASSLLCGLAPDPRFLIASRAAQGIGGAAMFATSLALMAHSFEGRDRAIAWGAWGATAGGAVAIGPLVGGALTSGVDWRWVFFVNVPIGVLTIALVLAKVAETRRRVVRPDWFGALSFGGALVALVYALIRGNPDGWSSVPVVGALLTGIILLVIFVVLQIGRREPMVRLALFRNPAFLGSTLGAITLMASVFAMLLYITLYLQTILGYSAYQAGLRFLPITLLAFLAAPVAGLLTQRIPVRLLLSGGLLLIGIGLALMTRVTSTADWTILVPGMVIAGAGAGLANPALASAAVGTVSADEAGVGSGVNNTARQIGIAAGIAGLGAVFQSRVHDVLIGELAHAGPALGAHRQAIASQVTSGSMAEGLRAVPPQLRPIVIHAARIAFIDGFDRILWVAVAVAIAGAVLTLVLVRQQDLSPAGARPDPDISLAAEPLHGSA